MKNLIQSIPCVVLGSRKTGISLGNNHPMISTEKNKQHIHLSFFLPYQLTKEMLVYSELVTAREAGVFTRAERNTLQLLIQVNIDH